MYLERDGTALQTLNCVGCAKTDGICEDNVSGKGDEWSLPQSRSVVNTDLLQVYDLLISVFEYGRSADRLGG